MALEYLDILSHQDTWSTADHIIKPSCEATESTDLTSYNSVPSFRMKIMGTAILDQVERLKILNSLHVLAGERQVVIVTFFITKAPKGIRKQTSKKVNPFTYFLSCSPVL